MGGGGGTVITKSYSSCVKYDQNGQPQKETYSTSSIQATDERGKRIGEKQSAYQNSKTREQKAAQERYLDNKAHKIVKSRTMEGGDEYEHQYYKGMNEGKNFIFI